MPKDTFNGLDNLILDQPDFIDLDEKVVEETDADKIAAAEKEKNDLAAKAKELAEKGKSKDNLLEIETTDDNISDEDRELAAQKLKDKEAEGNATQAELLKGWGEYFQKEEILTEDDLEGFDGTAEGLNSAFQKREVRVGLEMVEDYKAQLPDVLKFLADNWEDGVPLTDLLNIKSNQIRYANITDEKLEESVDTQKAVYAEYLRNTTKYSESKIEKEIARLVDLDELKSDAKEALVDLKKNEQEAEDTIRRESKKEQLARLEDNKKQIQTYEKLAKSTKEVIPGIVLDEKIIADVLKKVTTPIGIDGHGNPVSYIQNIRNEDPYSFDIKLNYLMIMTKGLTDFSKILTVGKTAATKDLSKILETPAPKDKKDGIDTTAGKKSVLDYLAMPQNRKS